MGPAEQAYLVFYHLVSLSGVTDADGCGKAHINWRSRVGAYGFQFLIAARAHLVGALGYLLAYVADWDCLIFFVASLDLCHLICRF